MSGVDLGEVEEPRRGHPPVALAALGIGVLFVVVLLLYRILGG